MAVVGGGPAGMSAACVAAERGHQVTLYERSDQLGGQFKLAMQIPGKGEFAETLRYFNARLKTLGVQVKYAVNVDEDLLRSETFDHIIVATGVKARVINVEGLANDPRVLSYTEAILNVDQVGQNVAVIGAGGIGFDVSELLLKSPHQEAEEIKEYLAEWGVDDSFQSRGGLRSPVRPQPHRTIYLLQRSEGKLGARLGKTTGWIHRAQLKAGQVEMLSEVSYERLDDQGLHITVKGSPRQLEVDHVIICAGQTSNRDLIDILELLKLPYTTIGGALKAGEIDAKRAIAEGQQVALSL